MIRTFLLGWRLLRGTNLLLLLFSLSFLLHKASLELPFLLLVAVLVGTLCIAAAGNVVNDIFDQAIDAINPTAQRIVGVELSSKWAWILYYILNVSALLLAVAAQHLGVLLCYSASIGLLWGYSSRWKCQPWWGNLAVAFLCALSLLQLLLLAPEQWSRYWQCSVSLYASFAFLTNWCRELVKDVEDELGDRQQACRTLVVERGVVYSMKIAQRICNALLVWLVSLIGLLGYLQYWGAFSYTVVILLPLTMYFNHYLRQSTNTVNIRPLSQLLKVYMLLGLLGVCWL